MTRFSVLAIALACMAACAADHDQSAAGEAAAARDTPGCIAGGDGALHARLRGAMVAELDWNNAQMQCEGGTRPDGGLRLAFAGRLPGTDGAPPRQLRFIFGVDQHDAAAGAALVLPTNLTVIVEGEQQVYATRGDEHCALESLERTPLEAGRKLRVRARGYCLGPATDLAGDTRLLVPTFEFTGVADIEEAEGTP